MTWERKLKWVQKNRERKDRHQATIGLLVRRLAERLQGEEYEDARRAARVVARVTDSTFRLHCRIGGFRGRAIVVTVNTPSLVAAMRGRWLKPLLAALQYGLAGRPVDRVIFEYGNSGTDIPIPATSPGSAVVGLTATGHQVRSGQREPWKNTNYR